MFGHKARVPTLQRQDYDTNGSRSGQVSEFIVMYVYSEMDGYSGGRQYGSPGLDAFALKTPSDTRCNPNVVVSAKSSKFLTIDCILISTFK